MPKFINSVTPLGIAFPKSDYPNPVKVSRRLLHSLYEADKYASEATESPELAQRPDSWDGSIPLDLFDAPSVANYIQHALSDEESGNWVRSNPEEYLRGLTDGFEIKRYRVGLEFEDGTRVVIREGEDLSPLKKYMVELQQGYVSRAYTLKPRPDKGIDVCRQQKDEEGNMVDRPYVCLRLSAISARHYTPTKDIKYPSDTDKRLQDEEAKGQPNASDINASAHA